MSASKIQRWTLDCIAENVEDDGDWVFYDDHAAEVARLQAIIDQTEALGPKLASLVAEIASLRQIIGEPPPSAPTEHVSPSGGRKGEKGSND